MRVHPCMAWRCLGYVIAGLLLLAAQTVVAADKLILASVPYRQEATLVSQFAPLAELLTRVYFESGQSQAYVARERAPLADAEGWHGKAA